MAGSAIPTSIPRSLATYYPHTAANAHQVEQASDLRGSQHVFGPEKLRELYGTPKAYAERVSAQVEDLVRERWLLAPEAELINERARTLRF